MALTKGDLTAVRPVIREETQGFARKSYLAQFATKDDLASLATKGDIASLKDELVAVECRLTRKIETEPENLAQITRREFGHVHRRTEALAHHVGYTF